MTTRPTARIHRTGTRFSRVKAIVIRPVCKTEIEIDTIDKTEIIEISTAKIAVLIRFVIEKVDDSEHEKADDVQATSQADMNFMDAFEFMTSAPFLKYFIGKTFSISL
jgi:hypothetical protein